MALWLFLLLGAPLCVCVVVINTHNNHIDGTWCDPQVRWVEKNVCEQKTQRQPHMFKLQRSLVVHPVLDDLKGARTIATRAMLGRKNTKRFVSGTMFCVVVKGKG